MEDKHRWTKGPWYVVDIEHKMSYEIRSSNRFQRWPVAFVKKESGRGFDAIGPEQAKAIAVLASLAPEMREALKIALPLVRQHSQEEANKIQALLEEAERGEVERGN